MTNEQLWDMSTVHEALDMAIEALQRGLENVNADSCSEEPNRSDTIYRQDAIDVVKGIDSYFVKYIEELPSAQPERECEKCIFKPFKQFQPERKKGEWIFKERREPVCDIAGVKTWGIAYMCSECGFIHTVIEDFGRYVYCPNCGADMRGEQNGND